LSSKNFLEEVDLVLDQILDNLRLGLLLLGIIWSRIDRRVRRNSFGSIIDRSRTINNSSGSRVIVVAVELVVVNRSWSRKILDLIRVELIGRTRCRKGSSGSSENRIDSN
jgi:hypothetical protein